MLLNFNVESGIFQHLQKLSASLHIKEGYSKLILLFLNQNVLWVLKRIVSI